MPVALENLPDGETLEWTEPNGARGAIIVRTTFQAADGAYCRRYQHTAGSATGQEHVACRDAAGEWQVR